MPFRDLAGHRRLLSLTSRAALLGTLPPSLIFAGPDGVGKRRAAVALAQLLNCSSPAPLPSADACGHCPSCSRIARGLHADVLVIEPGESGSIKVDQARHAIERSGYRPFEGRRRVVIIDQADAMEDAGQNALLKTLEEPPAASIFILITSRPDLLLPTVRSRCQRLRFGHLAPREVAEVLVRDHGFSEGDAQAAALVAAGSIGRALEEDSDAYVGARDAAVDLLSALATVSNPRQRLAAAKGLAGERPERNELGRRLRLVASILRDLWVLRTGADAGLVANADLTARLPRLLPSFDGNRLLGAFASIDRALDALNRNASPKIVADWVAFQV